MQIAKSWEKSCDPCQKQHIHLVQIDNIYIYLSAVLWFKGTPESTWAKQFCLMLFRSQHSRWQVKHDMEDERDLLGWWKNDSSVFSLLSTLCKLCFEVWIPEEFIWLLHLFTQQSFIIGKYVHFLFGFRVLTAEGATVSWWNCVSLHVLVYWALHEILKYSILQKRYFLWETDFRFGGFCFRFKM